MEPGHIVLAGSFTRVVFARRATRYTATSARLANLGCSLCDAGLERLVSFTRTVMPREGGASSRRQTRDKDSLRTGSSAHRRAKRRRPSDGYGGR